VKPSDFDWGAGRVVFWGMDDLDASKPLAAQTTGLLGEDLAQVTFTNGRLVDVGWQRNLASFLVLVVPRPTPAAWDRPILRRRARTWRGLRIAVRLAVNAAEGAAKVHAATAKSERKKEARRRPTDESGSRSVGRRRVDCRMTEGPKARPHTSLGR
jgi:hypothetical protein